MILGEGSGFLLLERADIAIKRGARIRAEAAGFGLAGDGIHLTAPDPKGNGAAGAMRAALKDARLSPDDLDLINAHGTATIKNDAMEAAAIRQVFGDEPKIPVNGIKGFMGHALGAAGAIEAAACCLFLERGIVAPTLGCEEPDPALGLNIVTGAPKAADLRRVLCTNSAFAGNNASLILGRFE